MIEMLRARKAQLEQRGKKGFTLMEMLIVIAIIAILIAIAIPIFTSQLAAARAATDEANIRSGYAQVQTELMLNNNPATSYTLHVDAGVTGTAANYQCQGNSTDAVNTPVQIGGLTVQWSAGNTITYTVDPNTRTITAIGGA